MHDYRRQAVAAYLQAHFPGHKLGNHYDTHAKAQVFRLSKKGRGYLLVINDTFFKNKTSADISSTLDALQLADALYRFATIVLDESGVHESRPKP